jgi:hypothetical protein
MEVGEGIVWRLGLDATATYITADASAFKGTPPSPVRPICSASRDGVWSFETMRRVDSQYEAEDLS